MPRNYNVNPYPQGWEKKVAVPEGVSGEWSVQKFSLNDDRVGLENLRAIRDGFWHRVCPPGDYTRLLRGRTTVMSDTPAEAHDHDRFYKAARGAVLINGLGLGFALAAILNKKAHPLGLNLLKDDERYVVQHVTVIERSLDVLKLVAPTFTGVPWNAKLREMRDARVTFVHADAREWRPARGEKFDVAWHDIWDNICGDNLAEINTLKRAYGHKTKWQGAWSEEYLR